jgi:hypothetical protein
VQVTQSQAFEVVFAISSSLISLLLFGNLFFLKRAIKKVDSIDALAASVTAVVKQLDKLCEQMEIVHELRIEVATLKARLTGYHRSNGERYS